jgi:hypothetical protein
VLWREFCADPQKDKIKKKTFSQAEVSFLFCFFQLKLLFFGKGGGFCHLGKFTFLKSANNSLFFNIQFDFHPLKEKNLHLSEGPFFKFVTPKQFLLQKTHQI